MTDLISTDHPLTNPQQQTLSALLDVLIPADDDGLMPSAGEVDLGAYVNEKSRDFLPALISITDEFEAPFAALSFAERLEQVRSWSEVEPELFQKLLMETYAVYYQQGRVLEGIGSKAGAPFPEGNTVQSGDLSLLDPVLAKPRGYRRV